MKVRDFPLQGLQGWSEAHDAGPSTKPTQGHRMSYIQFSCTILRSSRELSIWCIRSVRITNLNSTVLPDKSILLNSGLSKQGVL